MSLSNYQWPGPYTPMSHQIETTRFMADNPRSFVLNDMGTGKTASALWAIDYLIEHGYIEKALIVAPLSTLERVWRDEAFKLITHRRVQLLYGAAQKRKEAYERDWDIGVVNYDGLPILAKHIATDSKLNCILVDEATAYRNSNIARFDLMERLSERMDYFWLMTGTPTPQAPSDAYGLAKILRNGLAPKFFGSFRRATMFEARPHRWVPKPDGYEKAFRILQPAIRYRKEECIDLPPMTIQGWDIDLSKQQRTAYKYMQKKMKLEFSHSGGHITAVNAADKINKLRQIACGVIRDTKAGEYLVLDHKPRLEATLEAIEHASAKTIVVVPFKGIINHLAYEIGQHYSVGLINGDVSTKRRNQLVTEFMNTPKPHVLLVHPRVMAHGLTLTAADTMVFYAPIYSNEENQQIIQRINRPGQTRKMTVVQLGATGIEWQMYNTIDKRAEGEARLLNLYKQATIENC